MSASASSSFGARHPPSGGAVRSVNVGAEDFGNNVGSDLIAFGTYAATKRPVTSSLWILGLLLAAFANGFAVSVNQLEDYQESMARAEHVTDRELGQARRLHRDAEQRYYNAKGWFWQCDDSCQRALQKRDLARSRLAEVEGKRDALVKDARQAVGLWSTIGVQDVRNHFWNAWETGKEHAKRWTMMDAFFMMMPGERDRTIVTVIMQLIMQYVANLSLGMISAMFIFLWKVGELCYSYGENVVSGVLFFALVFIACVAVVASYIGAIGGGVMYGVKYVVKMEQQRLAAGGERRRVQQGGAYGNNWGSGQARRPHQD